jgi:hypothetical protein
MARGVRTEDWTTAAQALSLGNLSNTVLKATVTVALGKGRFRWLAASGLIVIAAALVFALGIAR